MITRWLCSLVTTKWLQLQLRAQDDGLVDDQAVVVLVDGHQVVAGTVGLDQLTRR